MYNMGMVEVLSRHHKKKKKFFELFPTPHYLLIATVGLSITDRAVQTVEFKSTGNLGRLILSHAEEVLLPAGAIISGYIHDKEAVTNALRELRKKHDFHYVRATLPEEKSYIFTVDMEKDPFQSLRDRVAFTVEENVPVSLDKSIFDFELIGSIRGKSEIKLAVTVVPIVEVEGYTEVMRNAGITPISFDIESQAVARAVISRGDERPCLILNLDEDKTGFYVAEDEVVQFSSTSSFGTRQVDGQYADLLSLKNDLRKTIVFWNTRIDSESIPSKKVEHIIVTGRGAVDEDFVSELMKGIDIDYELSNVWANAFLLDEYVPDLSYEDSFSYAAAIGVALPNKEPRYV